MAGSSNFVTFDVNQENLMSDTDYNSSEWRLNGVKQGIAPIDVHNKLYHQVSIFCAAFARQMADKGYTLDDSSYDDLITTFSNVLDSTGGILTGSLQGAVAKSLTSVTGTLTLTRDSNLFIVDGTEAITTLTGWTQGVATINWQTSRLLTHSASLLLQNAQSKITTVGDIGVYSFEAGGIVREINYFPVNGGVPVPIRQTVLKGSVDTSTVPNILAIGTGLNINVTATSMPTILTAAGGFDNSGRPIDRVSAVIADCGISNLINAVTIASITYSGATATCTTSSNHNLVTGTKITVSGATPGIYNGTYIITVTGESIFKYTMTATPTGNASPVGTYSVTNYIYADLSEGITTPTIGLPAPIDQLDGAVSTLDNQFTFVRSKMIGYLGNGSAAVPTWRVYIGECQVLSDSILSLTPYAWLNKSIVDTIPLTLSQSINNPHGLVTLPNFVQVSLVCIAADIGYKIGDELFIFPNYSEAASKCISVAVTDTLVYVITSSTVLSLPHRTTGILTAVTMNRWKIRTRCALV